MLESVLEKSYHPQNKFRPYTPWYVSKVRHFPVKFRLKWYDLPALCRPNHKFFSILAQMRIVTLFLCILSRIKSFIVEKQILEFDRAFFTRFWLCVFRVCANKPVNDRVVVRVDFMKICINRHFTMTKKQSSSQA